MLKDKIVFWENDTERRVSRSDSGQVLLRLRATEGQAITMMLLFMSGIMLSATVISGLLILYQVRQAIDAGSSARAIFAADAGTERALYCYYKEKNSSQNISDCNKTVVLSSGSEFSYNLSFKKDDGSFSEGVWSEDVAGFRVISRGMSGKTVRFLENTFNF